MTFLLTRQINSKDMNLSPQKQKLYDMYKHGDWVCSTAILFIRDFRKRISEMRDMGYNFQSMRCDGRCGTKHASNVHMYKLDGEPMRTVYKYELVDGMRVPRATLVPA